MFLSLLTGEVGIMVKDWVRNIKRAIEREIASVGKDDKSNIATISKDELKNNILDITLIDVRDPYLYKFGHIQGAEDIPAENIEEEFKNRYTPEKKGIVIYGEDEDQGLEAAKRLEKAGYHNIKLYKEGFKEWRHSHYPIKRVSMGNEKRE